MIPTEWKLIAGGIGVFAFLALAWFAYLSIEAKGEAKVTAILQPQLNQARTDLAAVKAANASNLKTIATMQLDAAESDALLANYANQITDLNQQADDAGAAIRKLQTDDQTVDAYLRTAIPDSLRGVLNDAAEPRDSHADAGSPAAAAR